IANGYYEKESVDIIIYEAKDLAQNAMDSSSILEYFSIYVYPLSIHEKENIFALYPNPSSLNQTKYLSCDLCNEGVNLVMFNLLGAKVYQSELEQNQDNNWILNIPDNLKGSFILQLHSGNSVANLKLLILD
ncbi:MAG: T9SS type A sorting domain-containing protein, partial [Bacteroidetes bacterium]|nr:T9SS type A sorting domain-containing protein [Bacteroidota bacterium]